MADTDQFRLRNFVDSLRGSDELVEYEDKIPLGQVAGRFDGDRRAVLLANVGPEAAELVGNVMGSRSRLARAVGCAPEDLLAETNRRSNQRLAPVEVRTDQAAVHEVTLIGEDADVTRLPVHLQHQRDGAPYISAALDVSRKTTDGWFNVGCRRFMLRGPRETGIDLNAPSDLRMRYQLAAAANEPLPVAVVIGSHPLDYMAAMTVAPPTDELSIMGALRGASVPVVRCATQDLLVPADAELVIEGYLDPAGYVHREGPYGEYLGYYGETKLNPVFHVTAITSRRDALFQTATISGRHLARTDTSQLAALATESGVWNALTLAVRDPRAVYVHPASGGMFNVRVAIKAHFAGDARNAIAAVFGSKADVKNVWVVDDDIDIFSDDQMEWALATRFQGDKDVVVGTGYRAVPLDPSLPFFGSPGGKAGFDLTLGASAKNADREWGTPAPPILGNAPATATSVAQALQAGPKSFVDIMIALGDDDGRGLVRDLHELVVAGDVSLEDNGTWAMHASISEAPDRANRWT